MSPLGVRLWKSSPPAILYVKLLSVQPPEKSSVPHRVRDPEAIAFLRDSIQWKMFTPFMSESSVSSAAKSAGVSLHKMYVFAQKGVRLGLLEVTRTEARKGRPIRFYHTVSESFFIAFEDMATVDLEDELLTGWHQWEGRVYAATAKHLEEVFERAEARGSGPWGRLYGSLDANFSQLSFASEKGFTKEPEVWRAQDVTPFFYGKGVLRLSLEQVRSFQKWADTLEDASGEAGAEPYFAEMTLVRLEE